MGFALIDGFGKGAEWRVQGEGFGRNLAVVEEVHVVPFALGVLVAHFVGDGVGDEAWEVFGFGEGRKVHVAKDLCGDVFGDGLVGGAVTTEDGVAFGVGVRFVEHGGVVEGPVHFDFVSFAACEGGLVEKGFGVGLGRLGFELDVGDGVGVDVGVVLDALGMAEDAFGCGVGVAVLLTIQGSVGWAVEEF